MPGCTQTTGTDYEWLGKCFDTSQYDKQLRLYAFAGVAEWQTRQTQNLQSLTRRVGSSPSLGIKKSAGLRPVDFFINWTGTCDRALCTDDDV